MIFKSVRPGGKTRSMSFPTVPLSPPPLILPPVVQYGLAQYIGSTYDRMKAIFISARPFPAQCHYQQKYYLTRMMCHGTRSAPLLPHIKGHYVQETSLIT